MILSVIQNHQQMINSILKIVSGVFLIFFGFVMIISTYRELKETEKFSVSYFLIIRGYGAGIGCMALAANILLSLTK